MAALAEQAASGQASWFADPQMRREFMQLLAEAQASRRLVRDLIAEKKVPGAEQRMTPSYMKLSGTTLMHKIGDFEVRAKGLDSMMEGADASEADGGMREYLRSFGEMIAAGSNEIMRNLIAERALGLPR